jgi:hypothetical protein
VQDYCGEFNFVGIAFSRTFVSQFTHERTCQVERKNETNGNYWRHMKAEARTPLNQGTGCDQHCMGAMQAAANAGTEPECKNY